MEKEVLVVNQKVSKTISNLKIVVLILSAIGVIAFVGNLIAGNLNSMNENIYVNLLLVSILQPIIAIPLINGFATIVKSAEYNNAQVESKYQIK